MSNDVSSVSHIFCILGSCYLRGVVPAKVYMSLSLIKHHAVETYLDIDEGACSTLRSGRFFPD
jgi:hypothetical protein